ncbi:MAG: hypothetical protein B6D34_11980 [Candidatus Brocadia sp. UTAMX1]|nr:MAG: hypothetical protein B6D34_11980 [Candidatus Brocadia sp. UTAMX1]
MKHIPGLPKKRGRCAYCSARCLIRGINNREVFLRRSRKRNGESALGIQLESEDVPKGDQFCRRIHTVGNDEQGFSNRWSPECLFIGRTMEA